ncbi:hypothetical protein VP01_1282g1 [Puccinia sorghi]|uniref:Uncharacterized protein n=1 Tax=Puccinia sorghi TaxID=27349 RepID=A0A0L6VQ68_9BASI|nr:hypothetical protein VP01_1282g1 [Puccinia sorghi]
MQKTIIPPPKPLYPIGALLNKNMEFKKELPNSPLIIMFLCSVDVNLMNSSCNVPVKKINPQGPLPQQLEFLKTVFVCFYCELPGIARRYTEVHDTTVGSADHDDMHGLTIAMLGLLYPSLESLLCHIRVTHNTSIKIWHSDNFFPPKLPPPSLFFCTFLHCSTHEIQTKYLGPPKKMFLLLAHPIAGLYEELYQDFTLEDASVENSLVNLGLLLFSSDTFDCLMNCMAFPLDHTQYSHLGKPVVNTQKSCAKAKKQVYPFYTETITDRKGMEIIFLQATPGLSHHLPDRIPHTLTWFSKQDELMDCTLAGDKEVQKYRADMLFRILENHLGYSRYHPLASVTTLVHLRNSSKHPGDASPSVWILYSFKIPQGRIFKIDFQVLDIKGQCKVFIAQLETVLQLIKTVWFCFICVYFFWQGKKCHRSSQENFMSKAFMLLCLNYESHNCHRKFFVGWICRRTQMNKEPLVASTDTQTHKGNLS